MLDDLPAPFIIDFNGVKLNLYNLNNNLLNIYNDEKSPYYHQNQFSENGNSIPVFIKYNNLTFFSSLLI